jgi:hypothetical protein
MQVAVGAILDQNVTIVYDALDLTTIDRNLLRELLDTSAPVIMDTPDMIVASAVAEALFVQIGDRRIRVTYQRQGADLKDDELCRMAARADALVHRPQSGLVAYGFNYDLGVVVENEDARRLVLEAMAPRRDAIEAALEGELVNAIPRFLFLAGGTRYDLIVEPESAGRLKVHLNTHFEGQRASLPAVDELRASFVREYERLVGLVSRLLTVGGRK